MNETARHAPFVAGPAEACAGPCGIAAPVAAVLRERTPRYRARPAFRERELARLWQTQAIPPEALVTDTGEEVHVVYRGRRGAGPGPDFRDAVIGTAGATLWKGDVELHVRASDFRRHGHHLDRAYLRLALHVVFEDDGAPAELLDGRRVPTVALARWVRRRAGELRAALADPGEYREPCHDAIARLGAERSLAVLTELGERRLRAKALDAASLVNRLGPEQALFVAIARALGLTKHVEAMEALARAAPLAELRARTDASAEPLLAVEAALLGAAGLLEGQLPLWSGAGDDRERRRLAAWHAAGAEPRTAIEWGGGPERPGCGPRERLCGLAALVVRPGPPFDATAADWEALLASGPRVLLTALQVPRFIGADRAVEIAVNAILPWLTAAFPQRPALAEAALRCYRELPGPTCYGRTRLLADALGDERGRTLVRGVAAVQGALQMTRDWCTQGGCGRCPLS